MMFYSDERAELEFRDRATAYATGILHGGIWATILSTIAWVIVIFFLVKDVIYTIAG